MKSDFVGPNNVENTYRDNFARLDGLIACNAFLDAFLPKSQVASHSNPEYFRGEYMPSTHCQRLYRLKPQQVY